MHDTPHVAPENNYTRTSVDHRVVTNPAIINTSQRPNFTAPTSSKLGCNNVSTVEQYYRQQTSQKSGHNSSTQILFEFKLASLFTKYLV